MNPYEKKEIKQLIEELVKQKLAEQLNQKEDLSLNKNASTVINIDNGSLILLLLSTILSKEPLEHDQTFSNKECEQLLKEVNELRQNNQKSFEELFELIPYSTIH